MRPRSGKYRPFPAYLEGGRADGCWISIGKQPEQKQYRIFDRVNFERDARLACRDLLGANVTQTGHPSGARRRSVRFLLEGGRSVIATQRKTPARAELEFRVLRTLLAQGAAVPKVLAFNGRFLFQQDLGDIRLSQALRKSGRAEGEKLLGAGLTSLTKTHATAKAAGLERHVVALGEQENWRRAVITHIRELGVFLGRPAPDIPVDKLVERLRVDRTHFIKWDARPPNAIVVEDAKVAWIDWEHCGRRNRLDDLVWFLGDQSIPDWPEVEDRLLDRHLPAFLDDMELADARDYLAVYGTFHMCVRLGLIVKKQYRRGLADWSSVVANGKVKKRARTGARRLSVRASRWAAKSPLTADLSAWLSEVAELFAPVTKRTDAVEHADGKFGSENGGRDDRAR